jgi:hypothetical protein
MDGYFDRSVSYYSRPGIIWGRSCCSPVSYPWRVGVPHTCPIWAVNFFMVIYFRSTKFYIQPHKRWLQ